MEGTFQRFKTCTECGGKGEQQEHKKVELADHVRVDVAMQPTVCTTCKGTGRIDMVDEIKTRIEANQLSITENNRMALFLIISFSIILPIIVLLIHETPLYLLVSLVADVLVWLVTRNSDLQHQKLIAEDRERIEIIEHMDTKAKHGLDPDPLFVDGQRVADVTVELNGAPDNHNYQDLPSPDTSSDEAARDARRMQNMRM